MIKIPGELGWKQHNRSDRLGSIWSSWNLDLTTNEGKLRVSPRTIITTDDITDLGVPVGFRVFTDTNGGVQYAWAVAGGYVFRMNLASGYQTAFAKDTSTGTPNNVLSSNVSDIEIFGKDWMVVTSDNDIYRFNPSNSQWNDGANELTGGTPHMLCVFGTRFYVTENGVKVWSFTPANYGALTTSSTNTLNLANKGWPVTTITFLRPTSSAIWIGTINQSEFGCWIFSWDGSTANDPNNAYYISDAAGVLACVIKDDVPWVVDSNGWLKYFNGGTFVKAKNGSLPVRNSKFLKNSLSSVNDRWLNPNGMTLIENRINILINNEHEDSDATIEENLPSGIWEYTEETGWVHKLPLSNYTSSIKDYGQNRVSRVGGLYAAKTENTNASSNGTMLIGAQLFSDSSTTKEVIMIDDSNDTVEKYGYLVTPKIYSDSIEDVWQELVVRHKKLLNSSDKIIVKYRTNDVASAEATITWSDTDTFTSTDADFADYVAGDEIEVIQGDGSGKTAHISSISEAGGTYTVNLDDTFTGVTTNTAKVRMQKWRKSSETSDQTVLWSKFPVTDLGASPWIQIKLCMQFTGKNEVDDLILINKKQQ